MKLRTPVLTLMAALAAGSASAATTYTTAGTTITNQAEASFTDPATNATVATPVLSNTVSTTVLPLAGFDIVYTSGAADGNTLANTTVVSPTTTPGSNVETAYSLINYGNVPLTVNLSADTSGSTVTPTVAYFLVGANNTRTPISGTVSLPVDNPATTADEGKVDIIQVITVPNGAAPGDVIGASPEGTVTGTGTDVNGNGYAANSTNYEDGKTQDTDLQFTRVSLFQPTLNNAPNTSTSTPIGPDGQTTTPPPITTTVGVPTVPAGTPNRPTPTQPATGYTYTTGNTPIEISGGIQKAYPPADTDNLNDVVVFTNSLTSTVADTAQLFPTDSSGNFLTGTTYDNTTGIFTLPGGITVQFLNPNGGTPITAGTGAIYPSISIPAGSRVFYQTKVTYPDADDSSPVSPITINIGADSLQDAGVISDSATTDTIFPAAAQFGDTTPGTQGAVDTPVITRTVNPNGGAATGNVINSPDATDATAVYPMDVANNGQYNDSFTVSGSVTVNVNGVATTLPLAYYDASGAMLPTLPSDPTKYITPVVGAGTEIQVYGVVTVNPGTDAGNYTVSQNAVGNYSTISMNDNNDVLKVSSAGTLNVAKFTYKQGAASETFRGIVGGADYTVQSTTALPGSVLKYKIVAKNDFNGPVANLFLKDTLPANTTFVSVQGSSDMNMTGKSVIYSTNGSTWTVAAPTTGTAFYVAVDDDANDNVLKPGSLPLGNSLTMEFEVKIN